MIEASLSWLFEQTVPLWVFIIALLTEPSTWSNKATELFNKNVTKLYDNN